jgi:hypothetical protein
MGEPLRFRLDRRMRAAVLDHAKLLAHEAGRPVAASVGVRDLLARALELGSPDAAYRSGWREGFLAGWADARLKATTHAAAMLASVADDDNGGPIGPQERR